MHERSKDCKAETMCKRIRDARLGELRIFVHTNYKRKKTYNSVSSKVVLEAEKSFLLIHDYKL